MSRPHLPRPVRLRSNRAKAEPAVAPAVRREIVASPQLRWINIERPQAADGEWLLREFAFHPLDLEDVFSRNQRPKLDTYDEYLFLVMQFPAYEKARKRLVSVELDVFIGPDYLVTLPNHELPPLEALFERF
jgi:magnesium transporter